MTNDRAESQIKLLSIALHALIAQGHTPSEIPTLIQHVQKGYNAAKHPDLPHNRSPTYYIFGMDDPYFEHQLDIELDASTSREEQLHRLQILHESIPLILHHNFVKQAH